MLESLLRAFFGSFFSTLGFAFLLRTPKQSWLVSSLIGAIGYTLYTLLIHFGVSEPASMFAGMLAASLLAHFAARRMRMIATIFLTLSIIPAVPGLGLYRFMALLAQGRTGESIHVGVTAMTDIVMISLALGVSSFLSKRIKRKVFQPCNPHH